MNNPKKCEIAKQYFTGIKNKNITLTKARLELLKLNIII
jgi:hypothetical protein